MKDNAELGEGGGAECHNKSVSYRCGCVSPGVSAFVRGCVVFLSVIHCVTVSKYCHKGSGIFSKSLSREHYHHVRQ